jgi:hypothetical protein
MATSLTGDAAGTFSGAGRFVVQSKPNKLMKSDNE